MDIEFAEDGDSSVEAVTRDNCFNSSAISFRYMYTTSAIGSGGGLSYSPKLSAALLPLLLAVSIGVYM